VIDVDPDIATGLERLVAGAQTGAPDWGDVLSRASVRRPGPRAWVRRLALPAFGIGIAAAIAAVILTQGSGGGSVGAGSCAALAHYQGARYVGEGVRVAPVPAGPAGTAVLPGCADQPGEPAVPQTVRVLRIRGISPRVAFMQPGIEDAIFVRDSLASHPPQAVARLERAPSCRPADAPIRLEARWDGILSANGGTELDWVPPYDLEILVRRTSAARYLRAFLTVRVPASLGRPLAKADFQRPLAITATCADGRFVAESVRTTPAG
jgi:hypothetical protein